jgi:hypothetical protein
MGETSIEMRDEIEMPSNDSSCTFSFGKEFHSMYDVENCAQILEANISRSCCSGVSVDMLTACLINFTCLFCNYELYHQR